MGPDRPSATPAHGMTDSDMRYHVQRILICAASLALLLTAGCGDNTDGGYEDPAKSSGAGGEPAEPTPGSSSARTIPSGRPGVPDIQILEVHKTGSGEACGKGRSATLKYKAMLANGQVVDPGSRPFTFLVGGGEAIAGWDIIVARMRVGDSWTVKIPSALAYGERGNGRIPPNADMRFDMELLSFQ